MTFLNPAMFWGLTALAVPIIIHFFNLQRHKQILFSNVAFVKEVKKSVVRRLRFRKWILLLLRLAAIACLVLAFANPIITGNTKPWMLGNRSLAIVIDDSYSMGAGNEKGPYFQQSKKIAQEIVDTYGQQDEFLLMPLSSIQLNASFGDQAGALQDIKDMNINQGIHAHSELLSFRKEIFSNAQNNVQEMYFLSDFQRSTVMADSEAVQLLDTSLLVKYIPLATREQSNVYVTTQKVVSQIIEKGQPIQMSMTLVNDGNKKVNELGVRVLLNDKVVAIANQSLEANSSTELELSFTPNESGWLSGHIELDDYPIEFDNKRYFSLYVPESERVLLVEGQQSRNLRLLYEELFQQFETEIISERNISSVQLNDYKSVILLGVKEFSSGLSDKLSLFLNEGGNIMFFPADNMNVNSANTFFANSGIGSWEELTKVEEGMKARIAELAHPLFDGIFTNERNNREFDAPNVYQYHPLKVNNASIQNEIIKMENGANFLLESKIGNGLIYTFSVFPGDAWTDFHVKTVFAPILFRATQIMSSTQQVRAGQEIGYYKPHSLRTTSQEQIQMLAQDGFTLIPEQYSQGGATVLNFDKLEMKEGNYRIVQGDSLLEIISFNISDEESRLDFINADKLRTRLDQAGYSSIQLLEANPEDIRERVEIEKQGLPLWKYFIVFAIVFLIAEILMLRFGKQ
jgi:hypothetical protein